MNTDAPDGHFDRHSILTRLLENYVPSTPEDVALSTFKKWSADRQLEFNERRAARIANGIVVKTPQLLELDHEVKLAEYSAGRALGRTGVILNGPPACGKTTAAFAAMVEAFRRHVARHPDWKRDDHIPVVYIEVPPGSTARGIMGRFLRFLEIKFIEKMTLEERTQLVTQHLQRARTSLIVVDEMQNLARLSNGNFESAQAIKNLLNSLKVVPLYVGFNLDTLFSVDDLGSQFAARSTAVEVDRLQPQKIDDKKLWRALIRAFEREFGLFAHPQGTLAPHAEYLFRRTSGSIGALSRLLTVAALSVAFKEPSEQIMTVAKLQTIKLDLKTEQLYDEATSSGGEEAPLAA